MQLASTGIIKPAESKSNTRGSKKTAMEVNKRSYIEQINAVKMEGPSTDRHNLNKPAWLSTDKIMGIKLPITRSVFSINRPVMDSTTSNINIHALESIEPASPTLKMSNSKEELGLAGKKRGGQITNVSTSNEIQQRPFYGLQSCSTVRSMVLDFDASAWRGRQNSTNRIKVADNSNSLLVNDSSSLLQPSPHLSKPDPGRLTQSKPSIFQPKPPPLIPSPSIKNIDPQDKSKKAKIPDKCTRFKEFKKSLFEQERIPPRSASTAQSLVNTDKASPRMSKQRKTIQPGKEPDTPVEDIANIRLKDYKLNNLFKMIDFLEGDRELTSDRLGLRVGLDLSRKGSKSSSELQATTLRLGLRLGSSTLSSKINTKF